MKEEKGEREEGREWLFAGWSAVGEGGREGLPCVGEAALGVEVRGEDGGERTLTQADTVSSSSRFAFMGGDLKCVPWL